MTQTSESDPDRAPGPSHIPADDQPRFLAGGPLQDPTLRTPGSEIPEALYDASASEPFDIRDPEQLPVFPSRRENPAFALLIAFILLAIILATAAYLYRDLHRSTLPGPVPSTSSSGTVTPPGLPGPKDSNPPSAHALIPPGSRPKG